MNTMQTRDTHAPSGKQTHKLPQQTCVVWLPKRGAYVSHFTPAEFCDVDHPSYAVKVSEELAEVLAQAVSQYLGERAEIRPYTPHSAETPLPGLPTQKQGDAANHRPIQTGCHKAPTGAPAPAGGEGTLLREVSAQRCGIRHATKRAIEQASMQNLLSIWS